MSHRETRRKDELSCRETDGDLQEKEHKMTCGLFPEKASMCVLWESNSDRGLISK